MGGKKNVISIQRILEMKTYQTGWVCRWLTHWDENPASIVILQCIFVVVDSAFRCFSKRSSQKSIFEKERHRVSEPRAIEVSENPWMTPQMVCLALQHWWQVGQLENCACQLVLLLLSHFYSLSARLPGTLLHYRTPCYFVSISLISMYSLTPSRKPSKLKSQDT